MVIILFGAPGVGKGTQATLLAERMNIPHLSTGDALRNAIDNKTEIGLTAKQYMNAGALVPDEVVTRIVAEALALPQFADGVILDGFPRTVAQAEALQSILSKHEKVISHVINIDVPEPDIIQRMLKRGRKDDTNEVIHHRLMVYENETAPLLEYYRGVDSVLKSIQGNADVETVYNRIHNLFF